MRHAPEFPVDVVSDECMERILDFVLHYEYELRQGQRLTGHEKAQLALLRRMLIDLGVDLSVVYDND